MVIPEPGSRLSRLLAAKSSLDEQAAQARSAYEEKRRRREAHIAETGRAPAGRPPKAPDEAELAASQANITDPESRIMKSHSGYLQGYNAQTAVSESQIVLAAELTQDAGDVHQLHPLIKAAMANLSAVGVTEEIGAILGDAGYFSKDNVTTADASWPELYLATQKDCKQRRSAREAADPPPPLPEGASVEDQMEAKLRTEKGKSLYKKRSATVEPVFGQTKGARGIDRFMRRGLVACDREWKLINLSNNLLKAWRAGRARARTTADLPARTAVLAAPAG